MYKGKKILAIIPARNGSKGLRDKNILPLNGKPLIAYAIDEATKTGLFDTIFVSTDSKAYADIAIVYGAEVPFLRPLPLADDGALAYDYVVHALRSYQEIGRTFDYFAILQPTSPFRTAQHIEESIHMLIDEEKKSVVSVTPSSHPSNCYARIPASGSLENFSIGKGGNRQDSEYFYRLNGAIYLCDCVSYLQTQTFYTVNSKAYIMSSDVSLDIDTLQDFEFAQWVLEQKALKKIAEKA